MKIKDDNELRIAISETNVLIQSIHDYLGNSDSDDYDKKEYFLRFPRGYLRTTHKFSTLLSFIPDPIVKKNLSYTLIFSDIHCWLLNRTDIKGTAREMIIKNGIVLFASIAEAICRVMTKGKINKVLKFKPRIDRMYDSGMIEEELKKELKELWDMRKSIHIYLQL